MLRFTACPLSKVIEEHKVKRNHECEKKWFDVELSYFKRLAPSLAEGLRKD